MDTFIRAFDLFGQTSVGIGFSGLLIKRFGFSAVDVFVQ